MLQIRWHGHACFEITNNVTLVTDPHDGKSIGIPAPSVTGDIILMSHDHYDHNSVKSVEKTGSKVVTDGRKRTIAGIDICGFESFHDECCGEKRGKNVIFKFTYDEITFCHLGDLGHIPTTHQTEKLGTVDILFVPIGDVFTIGAQDAWKTIKLLQPKVAIPMHYRVGGLSLSIQPIEPFLEQAEKVERVGNEIDFEESDIPDGTEIWNFTL